MGSTARACPRRDLIGGKAWSVARMQSLGLNVPAGVRRHDGGLQGVSRLRLGAAGLEGGDRRRDRLAGGEDRPELRRRPASAARLGPLGRAGFDAGHDGHRAQSRRQRRDGGGARRRMRRSRLCAQHAQALPRTLCAYRAALDGAGIRRDGRTRAMARGDCRPLRRGRALGRARAVAPRRARRVRVRGTPAARVAIASITIFPTISAPPSPCRRWCSAISTQRSGTGVLFSRNPTSGAREPYGEYLPRAQGEDVVSGKFTPEPLSALGAQMPETLARACSSAARKLEQAGRDVQDIEFTVERGRLYLLQSRAAKLAPHAAAQIAVDLAREGLIDERAAVLRVTPDQVRILLSPHIRESAPARRAASRLGRSRLARRRHRRRRFGLGRGGDGALRQARRWSSRGRRQAPRICTA